MCVGTNLCILLGPDMSQWDRFAPLRPPEWHRVALRHFASAVALASEGRRSESIERLALVRGDELSRFFIDHAQNAWRARLKFAGLKPPPKEGGESLRYSSRVEREVYERDGYVCRYCDSPVVTGAVLKAYSRVVGADAFPTGATNRDRHGAALVFRATADHVRPRSGGGTDSIENLVTACWPCNYGKGSCSLESLRLDDPRERLAAGSPAWHGLSEHLAGLLSRPSA